MKYIVAIWVVLIIGAAVWVAATRPPSWLKPSDTDAEAAPVDPGVSRTSSETDAILDNSPSRGFRPRKAEEARVTQVLEGDAIEVELDGERIIVAYLGIETPEVDHPVLGTEPFGEEALARNRELVEGKTVFLEKDIVQTDREGRRLRYVYVGDLMVNALLLHEGLAKTHDYARGLKYAEVLYELQNQATVERRGGWRDTWPNILRRQ